MMKKIYYLFKEKGEIVLPAEGKESFPVGPSVPFNTNLEVYFDSASDDDSEKYFLDEKGIAHPIESPRGIDRENPENSRVDASTYIRNKALIDKGIKLLAEKAEISQGEIVLDSVILNENAATSGCIPDLEFINPDTGREIPAHRHRHFHDEPVPHLCAYIRNLSELIEGQCAVRFGSPLGSSFEKGLLFREKHP